jgi:uncharacterized protein YprB with RNaseH-like and TPR domain
VIESTFLHLPRTGATKEQRLWESGVHTWHDFLRTPSVRGFSKTTKTVADDVLSASQRALAKGDSTFFRALPSVQHWRLYPTFREEAVFVDIETSWRGDVTVLGVYDGSKVKQFIRGENLNAKNVRRHLDGKLIITYNGASFDLPVLRRCFGDVVPSVPHFDTMHLARRLGYRGGLKALERDLGITRPSEVDGMSGADALTLWDAYRKTGNETHLKTLLAYNEEDIVNLQTVADKIVKQAVPSHLHLKAVRKGI